MPSHSEISVKWAFCLLFPPTPCPDMATNPPPQRWLLWDWNSILWPIMPTVTLLLVYQAFLLWSTLMCTTRGKISLQNTKLSFQLCPNYTISVLQTLPWTLTFMPHVPHSIANLSVGNKESISRWPHWGDTVWTGPWEMGMSFTDKGKGESIPKMRQNYIMYSAVVIRKGAWIEHGDLWNPLQKVWLSKSRVKPQNLHVQQMSHAVLIVILYRWHLI